MLKEKLKKIIRFLTNDNYRFQVLAAKGVKSKMHQKRFLEKMYRITMGKSLDLNNPVTYTEKLQWLKLYDHRPIYTSMVDKCEAKKYVESIIGRQYIIPTIGVWDSPDDIDFDKLPNKFVLKCNHNSGLGMCICTDKSKLDVANTKKILKKGLKQDYYMTGREWPYKNVPRKIIAETYMEDSHCQELRDYKFFTFNGEPKVMYITQGRSQKGQTVADFFDMEFKHLPFIIDHEMAPIPPDKPQNFELMKELAAKLSEGTPQLRVDFYEVNGKVYFGEMTFFHCSGFAPFYPEEWDQIFGDWVTLPPKRCEV